MGYVITIDGPAASGKSSVSRELSKIFGIPWVSTGSFYRGLGYVALQENIDLNNPTLLSELCHSSIWKVVMHSEKTQVWYKDSNVTDLISKEEVGNVASRISHYPEVRQSLLDHQRLCALNQDGLIAEGRDCGTVVFPHAEFKFYLTANSENRALRRAQELGLDEKKLEAQQRQRDEQDSSRKVAPLQAAADAFIIDTTALDLNQVVSLIHSKLIDKI